MLVKDPLSRITLSEIKQDDFYRVNKIFMETDYNLNEDVNSSNSDINHVIILKLVKLGYSKDTCIQNVKEKKRNKITTIYELYLKQHLNKMLKVPNPKKFINILQNYSTKDNSKKDIKHSNLKRAKNYGKDVKRFLLKSNLDTENEFITKEFKENQNLKVKLLI